MPGPKAQVPAPIDRPLSRAYLREFAGWSTAYPPGMSEPTSLRIMENVMINRDGSVRIRPGLRYVNYMQVPDADTGVPGLSGYPLTKMVGTHETFFLNDGSKAYLYAVREADGRVNFRVLTFTAVGQLQKTLAEVDFTIPQGEEALKFSAATTYVKYLQIDNKIFALSNAGEEMRLFFVGADKIAKRLNSITRPEWTVEDKLTVVHPDAGWINDGVPLSTRQNLMPNPSFEANLDTWVVNNTATKISRVDDFARNGTWSLKLESLPDRTNLVKKPLHNIPALGIGGWTSGSGAMAVPAAAVGSDMRVRIDPSVDFGQVYSHAIDVEASTQYHAAFDLTAVLQLRSTGFQIYYYDANDNLITATNFGEAAGIGINRKVVSFTTPGGCANIRIHILGYRSVSTGTAYFQMKNVLVAKAAEDTAMFHGSLGGNYFWTGPVNDSASVYHPPKDVEVKSSVTIGPALDCVASAYIRAGSNARNVTVGMIFYRADGANIAAISVPAAVDAVGAWTRFQVDTTTIATTSRIEPTYKITSVTRGEAHYIDSTQFEKTAAPGDPAGTYFDGSTPSISGTTYTWDGAVNSSTSTERVFGVGLTLPPAETKTANTLISSTAANNIYSFGFFYTFSNEIGESAVSQVTVVRAQRPWSGWKWETPNVSGEPSGTATKDPAACADQLAAYMAPGVFTDAIAAGAISWSLYMFTWSDQDTVPVSALKVSTRELKPDSDHDETGWLRATPNQSEATAETSLVPTLRTRFNASNPSRGAQGLVAADRMVLVLDPTAAAVIKWTSNQQGFYSDFSPSKGGGYKTLTSGNLFVPAVVKLWQNPQSADTLTILCMGVDGHSTGYYMAPAQVSSQSESINIMGFEETTATPGTTSPFGCEVMNNALYHPIDEQLMKSVASNYNINHSSTTDMIQDSWRKLTSKQHIVSSQLDNRIYFLVNNPDGLTVETGCWGNEVWVFDGAQKAGSWSRWLVQGQSLRKIEQAGRVVMSLVHPTGIYYFDELSGVDDYVDPATSEIQQRNIPWQFETNTQGANRAHDAWAHLQQANIMFGFVQGQIRYGLRGLDINGKPVNMEKTFRDTAAPGTLAFDVEDFMLIRKDMKEWFFFASSVSVAGVVQPSFGQISLVQYRYTPSTVNTGYEFGSVETFEYGRSDAADATTTNGVPRPFVDTRRP